jgi:hypothetical protein
METATEQGSTPADSDSARLLARLCRDTTWTQISAIPLRFNAFHPQGMVRLGDRYLMTAVEVLERPVRRDATGDCDRTPGAGIGHLFQFDADGALLRDVPVGEGPLYHPGGLDYDGRCLWVPVAEYRPNGRAILYRVNPQTLRVTEAFRAEDHIGAIVRDRASDRLIGMSWGSRTFYVWNTQGDLLHKVRNPEQFIDFQDCHYVHHGKAVCSGVAGVRIGGSTLQLGGVSLIDLGSLTAINTVPVTPLSPAGHSITRNPVWIEAEGDCLILQAVPDDGCASLLTYRTPPLG